MWLKMVGSTSAIMKVRLVRSKLRKREESSSASPTDIEAQQQHQHQHQQQYALHTRVSFADSNGHQIGASNGGYRQGSKSNAIRNTNINGLTIEAVAANNKNNQNSKVSNNCCHNNVNGYSNTDSNSASPVQNINNNCKKDSKEDEDSVTFTRTSGSSVGVTSNGWVFPPKAPTPHIYNCMTQVSSNLSLFIIQLKEKIKYWKFNIFYKTLQMAFLYF